MKKTLIALAMVMASGSAMATETAINSTGDNIILTASAPGTAATCVVTASDSELEIGFGDTEAEDKATFTVLANYAGATADLVFEDATNNISNLDSTVRSTADVLWVVNGTDTETESANNIALTEDSATTITVGAKAVGFTADNILFDPTTGEAGAAEVTTTVTITCSDYAGDSAATGA